MQDPNADTEWNDILRKKGILPPKDEITEEDIVNMVEQTIEHKTQDKDYSEMSRDELDDLEDEINDDDERAFEMYRRQRMMELTAQQKKDVYGTVLEISKADWVEQVNKAGEDIFVILHIYKNGIPICKLLNQHLIELANKFKSVKFVRGVSEVCIPNYPDKNLPTIFIYKNGDMKKQWIGPHEFYGMSCKVEDLEWMFASFGAVKTDMEENPRRKVEDMMQSSIRNANASSGDQDDNDW